jgi:hypothetical protein
MRWLPRHWFAFAAALAIPACLLTHESFQPLEQRVDLQGSAATWSFELASPQSLYLEFEYVVQTTDDSPAGIVLRVNDAEVAAIQAAQLFVTQHAMPLVPATVVRAGANRLQVQAVGSPSATFDMNLRLHNYYGINPRFPRAFVVSDDAVSHFFRQRSLVGHLLRFGVFYLVSVLVVWSIARTSRRLAHGRARVLTLASAILLWMVLLYALVAPLHIWVPVESLAVLALVPILLAASLIWMSSHRRLVVSIAGPAIVTVVFLEISLRVFNYFVPTPVFYTSTYNRYRGQPGAPFFDSRLNSLGFNDIEYERGKPPGVSRIAAIGDSVAFGVVPYGANYLTLLERELAPGKGVEVINLGVPGTEPRDYLSVLLQEGLAFDPDVIMVGMYIGNDFESAARKPHEYSFAATSLYFLWRLATVGMPAVVRTNTSAGDYKDEEPTLEWEQFLEIEVGRARIFVEDDAAFQTRARRAVAYLRDMRDVAARVGAKMLVVVIPGEVQIDRELQDRVVRAHGSASDRFDFARPNRVLAAELSRAGIPFLDLLPVFETEGQRTRLYKPRDTHWNLAGNRLAARTIGRFLREQMPLGAEPP